MILSRVLLLLQGLAASPEVILTLDLRVMSLEKLVSYVPCVSYVSIGGKLPLTFETYGTIETYETNDTRR